MNAFSEMLAPWLADFFLLSTLLLAVVLAVGWCVGQPSRRMAIARPTLAALVLLTGLCALPSWSLVHLLTENAAVEDAGELSNLPAAPSLGQSTMKIAPTPPVETQSSPTIAPPALSAPEAKPMAWTTLLVGSYLCGCVLTILWQASGGVLARRLISEAAPAPPQLQALLRDVGETGKRLATLAVSSRIHTPAAIGVFRPTILLPQTMLQSQEESLRPILAHELAHIRHGDLRMLAAVRGLMILLWPQPLYWLLRRQIRRDQETLADAAAAEVTSRSDFAEQLVAWARVASESPGAPAPRLASSVGLWESPSQLKRRVAMLLDERFHVLRNCSRQWRVGTVFVMAGFAIGLSFVSIWPTPSLVANEEDVSQKAKRFSFGSKVEVVAIGAHDENIERWWDETGKAIDSVSFSWSRGRSTINADGLMRRIIIRVVDLPEDARLAWRIQGATRSSSASVTIDGQANPKGYYTKYFAVADGRKSFGSRVGIAAGPWKTVAQAGLKATPTGGGGKSVVFSGVVGGAEKTTVVVSHNYSDQDYRIFAIDKQGKEHIQSGWGGCSSGKITLANAAFPGLAVENVDHFEFRVRDYEWVEFKNLPLNPRDDQPYYP